VTAQSLKSIGKHIIARVPLARIGTAEDVAGTALYLASRAGAFVNGATIVLDGGSVVNMPTGKL
jgi:NAD(P)-dependent dehydrogenase (short-subunit alcohol dehydrogenase family)